MFACNSRPLRRVVVALALVAVAATPHAQTSPATSTGVISGRVVADATDQPVRRAHVIAVGTNTRVISITSTDADGQFEFPVLPEDRFRIGVSRPPYVSVVFDAPTTPATVRLVQGAVISGQILSARIRPQGGVVVTVHTSAGVEAGRATTDARGLYRVHGLAAGTYNVSATGIADPVRVAVEAADDRSQAHFTLPPVVEDAATEKSAGIGTITGRAISSVDGRPLAEARVELTGVSSATVLTSNSGIFEFRRLPVGQYTVRLDGGGVYGVPVDVTATPVTNVVLRGVTRGSVTGVVRDDRGDPLVNAPINVYERSQITDTPFLLKGVVTQTDERGAYWIGGLMPGDYLVCACDGRLPRLDPTMLRALLGSAPPPEQLLPFMTGAAAFTPATFYPGRARAIDAVLVSLTDADHRHGIDITVPVATTYTVSGRLDAQDDVPVEGTSVRLVKTGDVPEAITLTEMAPRSPIRADGRFSIPGVPPGSYAIVAFPPRRIGPTGVTEITVDDRDVSGVTVPVSSGGSVRGRLAFAHGATPPSSAELAKARIEVSASDSRNLPLVRMADPSGILDVQTYAKADGSFALMGLPPGQYRISIGGLPLPWHTIETLTTLQGVASGHSVTVEPGGNTDVVITMSPLPPATLEGSVQLNKDEGPQPIFVVIFAADWRTNPLFFKNGVGRYLRNVGADGSFRVPVVPAGDYYLAVDTQSPIRITEARLAELERSATRVTLRAGETTRVTLKR